MVKNGKGRLTFRKGRGGAHLYLDDLYDLAENRHCLNKDLHILGDFDSPRDLECP